jgi:hypothetical protein
MSELNDMTCGELADVAAELALGVLTGRERASAIAHLSHCEACREDVRQLMVTGEQLLELLPAAEPPAGFETRVLERLGLPGPAPAEAATTTTTTTDTYPQLISSRESTGRRRGPGQGRTRPGADQPGAPPAGPGGTRRPGRVRRLLAATAIGLAVIAAGLGGWRIGAGTGPAASTASGTLTPARLLSATHQQVGEIFLYSARSRWVYMRVDLGTGNELVTCQIVGTNGQVTTIGSFALKGGYGSWGAAEPGTAGSPGGARIVAANGAVLATATFAS